MSEVRISNKEAEKGSKTQFRVISIAFRNARYTYKKLNSHK